MFVKRYKSIMEKPEEYRNRWALGMATTFSVFILVGFAFYKDYIHLDLSGGQVVKNQVVNVIVADDAPSPMENTKEAFASVFKEVSVQFGKMKESLASVLVPFWSNIEVYEK
jgi:hypothetical protein